MLKLRLGYANADEMAIGEYVVSISERATTRVDSDALKRDGLYDQYSTASSYQMVKVKATAEAKRE